MTGNFRTDRPAFYPRGRCAPLSQVSAHPAPGSGVNLAPGSGAGRPGYRHNRGRSTMLRALAERLTALVLLGLSLLLASSLAGCHSGTSSPASSGSGPGASQSTIRFSDVTDRAGITWQRSNGGFGQRWITETMGGGGAFIDYDRDGYQDILLVNGDWYAGHAPAGGKRPTLALYHNNHDGTFTDVTAATGLDVSLQGMGAAIGDYDNDGWDDILVTGVGGNHLFHNEHGKRFVDVTKSSGVGGSGWSTSAAWLDYDNDGKLDLFVCHYVRWSPQTDLFCGGLYKSYCTPEYYAGESCRLYHNDGGGHFTDVTEKAGILNNSGKSLGVCPVDVDGDGRVDILVANDTMPDYYYHNNGDGTFTETGLASGFAMGEDNHPRGGMGIDAADYNHTGALSVAVGNFAMQGVTFYKEMQPGLFVDDSTRNGTSRPSYPLVTFGLVFCDFDNDGWKDLMLANGHVDDLIQRTSPVQHYEQPPLLLRNLGNGTFEDVSATAGLGPPLVGRGLAWGDIDNDGRPDVLMVPNVGRPRLLHNDTPTKNHWIKILLQGTKSNRDGFGAVVRVTAGGVTQMDVAHSGSSYCSQSDRRLNFGLGSASSVDTLDIRWPGGQHDTWHNIPADHILTLTEGQAPVT